MVWVAWGGGTKAAVAKTAMHVVAPWQEASSVELERLAPLCPSNRTARSHGSYGGELERLAPVCRHASPSHRTAAAHPSARWSLQDADSSYMVTMDT